MSKKLSYWGWGYANESPTHDMLREIANLLAEYFDFNNLSIENPMPLKDLSIPDSRIKNPNLQSDLIDFSKRARITHTYGKGYRDLLRGFRGDFSVAPDLVAKPKTEKDVEKIIEWASKNGVSVIPFGGGTSVVAGIEPDLPGKNHQKVLSLDMKGMNDVLDIDKQSELARIQAGPTGPELEAQLQSEGYTLRHYPQSYEFSTLGGWIATRASGHYATNETRIDDLVTRARMVTPTDTLDHANVPSTGAGPDPDSFTCGSEGTLGVITEATMKIRKKPTFRSKASVFFEDFWDAVEATRKLAQSRLNPANCRLLNPEEAFINQVCVTGDSVLLLGFESRIKSMQDDLSSAIELCSQYGGRCPDGPSHRDEHGDQSPNDQSSTQWKKSFFEGPYLFNALVQLGMIVDTFETACSWSNFEDFHKNITNDLHEIMKKVSQEGFISCRFTHVYPDGPVPYYTFIVPGNQGSEISQWTKIKKAASKSVVRNGGTITHHHAVGRIHRQWLKKERSQGFLKILSSVKNQLDPDHLMNPGALIK